jgi:hypothetical protein
MKYTKQQKITVLNEAIIKLQNHKWIRYYSAKMSDDKICSPRSAKACQFCAVGSIAASTKSNGLLNEIVDDVEKLFSQNNSQTSGRFRRYFQLSHFNDDYAKSKRDVIRLFKKTIRSLET